MVDQGERKGATFLSWQSWKLLQQPWSTTREVPVLSGWSRQMQARREDVRTQFRTVSVLAHASITFSVLLISTSLITFCVQKSNPQIALENFQ